MVDSLIIAKWYY